MEWKTMLSYISGSVDEELLLRNEYLVAENRVLRNQPQGCLRLTDGERRSLAELGKRLGKQALDEIASIVNPVLCQNSALLKDHGCNLMHRKVLASFYQHIMAEAPMRSV